MSLLGLNTGQAELLGIFGLLSGSVKSATNTHGYFAGRFAERYVSDAGVLDVIELHDSAFKGHRPIVHHGDFAGPEQRARHPIARSGDRLGLYRKFHLCDNRTGDKGIDHYVWIRRLCYNLVHPHRPTRNFSFSASWKVSPPS